MKWLTCSNLLPGVIVQLYIIEVFTCSMEDQANQLSTSSTLEIQESVTSHCPAL